MQTIEARDIPALLASGALIDLADSGRVVDATVAPDGEVWVATEELPDGAWWEPSHWFRADVEEAE